MQPVTRQPAPRPPDVGFDCYNCTLQDSPDAVLGALSHDLGLDVERIRSPGRWSAFWKLTRGTVPYATLAVADDRPDEPFLECKSTAPYFVPIIRERWPDHRLARVDVPLNLYHDDYWLVLEAEMLRYAKKHDVYMSPDGPHLQPELGGRTWYMGRKSSARLLRMYEKGSELGLTTRNPIRLELQVRPPSRQKKRYATLTPQEILLEHRFVAHVTHAMGIDLGTAPIAAPRPPRSDLDRLLDVMARQYLPTFRLCRERFTTMDEFITDLESRRERDAEISRTLLNSRPSLMMQPNVMPHRDSEQTSATL